MEVGSMEKKHRTDVLVIGGGVIGLACAYYLATSGRQVHLIDQDTVGAGASHGNCGLLFFSDLPPLCVPGAARKELCHILDRNAPLLVSLDADISKFVWLLRFAAKCNPAHLRRAVIAREKMLRLSHRLYRELLADETVTCDWQRRGVLMVYQNQADMDAYAATNALLAPYGLAARALSRAEAVNLEPALRPEICGAWHHEVDSHLRPEKLVQALLALVRRKGVTIDEHCGVRAFETAGGRITAAVTARGHYAADTFVLAAGAWTPLVAKSAGVRVPIQPGKGYSLTLRRPQICPRIPCYLHGARVVVTSWADSLRLGGTMEFSGFNLRLDRNRLANLREAAKDYLHPFAGATVLEEWVGMRPMTHDDLPIIGRSPAWPNLLLASGHGMMGLTMATGTGRLVADLAGGLEPAFNPAPFSPFRFS
jgi:D-amino-acid dehydrogenase